MNVEELIRAALHDEAKRIRDDVLPGALESLDRRIDDEAWEWVGVDPTLRPVLQFIARSSMLLPAAIREWSKQPGLLILPMVTGGAAAVEEEIPIPASKVGGTRDVSYRIPDDAVSNNMRLTCLTDSSLVSDGVVRIEGRLAVVASNRLPDRWNAFTVTSGRAYTASNLFLLRRSDDAFEQTPRDTIDPVMGLIRDGRLWEAWEMGATPGEASEQLESRALMIWSQMSLLFKEVDVELAAEQASKDAAKGNLVRIRLALIELQNEVDSRKQAVIETRIPKDESRKQAVTEARIPKDEG